MTYAEKLTVFKALSPIFVEGHVRQMMADGSILSGWWIIKSDKHGFCNCCGTKRLKYLFPVLTQKREVYWIGSECQKNLREDEVLVMSQLDFDNSIVMKEE